MSVCVLCIGLPYFCVSVKPHEKSYLQEFYSKGLQYIFLFRKVCSTF